MPYNMVLLAERLNSIRGLYRDRHRVRARAELAALVDAQAQDRAMVVRLLRFAIERGDPGVVLMLANRGAAAIAGDEEALVLRATALQQLGRLSEAEQLLIEDGRQTPIMLERLALVKRASGALDEARRLYGILLSHGSRQEPTEGLPRVSAALQALGRYSEALALLNEAKNLTPVLRLRRAKVLWLTGRPRESLRDVDALLARAPANRAGLLHKIELGLAMDDLDMAEAALKTGLSHRPDDPTFRIKEIALARRRLRNDHALKLGKRLSRAHPRNRQAALLLAELETRETAAEIFAAILAEDPGCARARVGFARSLVAEQRDADALELLSEAVEPANCAVLLEMLTITARLGRRQDTEGVAKRIAAAANALPNRDLIRFITSCEELSLSEAYMTTLSGIFARKDISCELALALLKRAHASIAPDAVQDIYRALRQRVVEGHRYRFDVQAHFLMRGAKEAVAFIRATPRSGRVALEAKEVAYALREAGEIPLAIRYLKLCCRHHPSSSILLNQLVSTLVSCGRPGEALAMLDACDTGSADEAHWKRRVMPLLELGNMPAADALLAEQPREALRGLVNTAFRIALAQERLEEARALAQEVKQRRSSDPRFAHHFSSHHIGALLNDLEIAVAALSRDGSVQRLVGDHYPLARRVLAGWVGACGAEATGEGAVEIPRKVFQYWNTSAVPEVVDDIMQSWKGSPGWRYERFDRRRAIDWLGMTFGMQYVRAFRLANNIAEECDFLRLCLLSAEGGVYADADDRLYGPIEALIGGRRGALLFIEPHGAILNSFLCAAPGHPVIVAARDMALEALLARDNENTWGKTGPGLISRAAARHRIVAPLNCMAGTTLLPRYILRRSVYLNSALPYKSTPAYWNSTTGPLSDSARHTLETLTCGGDAKDHVLPIA